MTNVKNKLITGAVESQLGTFCSYGQVNINDWTPLVPRLVFCFLASSSLVYKKAVCQGVPGPSWLPYLKRTWNSYLLNISRDFSWSIQSLTYKLPHYCDSYILYSEKEPLTSLNGTYRGECLPPPLKGLVYLFIQHFNSWKPFLRCS